MRAYGGRGQNISIRLVLIVYLECPKLAESTEVRVHLKQELEWGNRPLKSRLHGVTSLPYSLCHPAIPLILCLSSTQFPVSHHHHGTDCPQVILFFTPSPAVILDSFHNRMLVGSTSINPPRSFSLPQTQQSLPPLHPPSHSHKHLPGSLITQDSSIQKCVTTAEAPAISSS